MKLDVAISHEWLVVCLTTPSTAFYCFFQAVQGYKIVHDMQLWLPLTSHEASIHTVPMSQWKVVGSLLGGLQLGGSQIYGGRTCRVFFRPKPSQTQWMPPIHLPYTFHFWEVLSHHRKTFEQNLPLTSQFGCLLGGFPEPVGRFSRASLGGLWKVFG